MRWDEIIDPRLRAYRKDWKVTPWPSSMSRTFPTPHDEPWPEPPYAGTPLDALKAVEVSMELTDEAIKKVLQAFDVPPSIVGVDPEVRSTP